MNENIRKFIEKASEDKALQEKMAACRNPDEAYEIAISVQDGFTKEEFVESMQELYDITHETELTRADLAKVAGGDGTDDETLVVSAISAAGISSCIVVSVVESLSGAAV